VCRSFSSVDAGAPWSDGARTGVPGYGPCAPEPRCSGAIICASGYGRYRGLRRRADNPLHSSRTKEGAANKPAPELQEFFARIQSGDEGAVAERRHAGSLPGEWEPARPEPDVGKRVEDQDFAAATRGRLDEIGPFACRPESTGPHLARDCRPGDGLIHRVALATWKATLIALSSSSRASRSCQAFVRPTQKTAAQAPNQPWISQEMSK
jgi:hypothetical protein